MDTDFRSLRATLDFLMNLFQITEYRIKNSEDNTNKHGYMGNIYTSSAIITLNDRVLGVIGYLPHNMVGFELVWRDILEVSRRWPTYHSVAKTAQYHEDWTVQKPNNVPVGTVMDLLKNSSPFVHSVQLRDQYNDNWTFRITFLDPEEQFRSERAEKVRKQVQAELSKLECRL